MSLHFESKIVSTEFWDSINSEQTRRETEIRFDPLTGQTIRLLGYPMPALPTPEREQLGKSSRENCPFCPATIETATPKFIHGDERIKAGSAVTVPNLMPYDEHSAVTVITKQHFIAPRAFKQDQLRNGFRSALAYLQSVQQRSSTTARIASINWNYFPESGGSIIHPHFQVVSGPVPSNYQRTVVQRSLSFFQRQGRPYWQVLIDEEKQRDERFIGSIGSSHWMTPFAPRGPLEIAFILQEVTNLHELESRGLNGLVSGILAILRYVDDHHFPGWNMTIHIPFQTQAGLWVHGSFIPRFTMPPFQISDANYFLLLHDDNLSFFRPEEVCHSLKEYF